MILPEAQAGDIELDPKRGKKNHQKMKPYLVLQYLMRHTDEEHPATALDIGAYLFDECEILSERRSIYRDIDEINKVLYMLDNKCTIEEATEAIDDDEYDEEKVIVYKPNKGFYVRQRQYDENDIRLLAECVYSARFLDIKRSKKLVDVVCSHVSETQAEKIKHDVYLVDRTRTDNTAVYYSVSTINDAMSKRLDGEAHTPEKISFHYTKYSINDMSKTVARRKGAEYTVSPYQLLMNDGNYYLLAYSDRYKEMRTYRVDRMKDVTLTGVPRDGKEAFDALDMDSYTKRVFGMYGGDRRYCTIRFINPLLDTAIDRFGRKRVIYRPVDERHFTIETEVEISDQFFSWLCGFGKRVKIMAPDEVAQQYRAFLDKICRMYDPE